MDRRQQLELKTEVEPIYRLAANLRDHGVKGLFLGDGDHASTSVNLNLAVGAAAFLPDLLFIEYDARCQPFIDRHRGNLPEPNFFLGESLASRGGTKVFAVDEPHRTDPWSAARLAQRLSVNTQDHIAERIVTRIEAFQNSHGYLPSFAVVFGKSHFATQHNLNEIVESKLKERGLGSPKSCTVEVDHRLSPGSNTKLRHNWFGYFDYSVDVAPSVPPGLPDYTEFEGKAKRPTPPRRDKRPFACTR